MLYDRIVDNKGLGRKIWKICTAFYNDLYNVERFVLRWMIFYFAAKFVRRRMICIALKDLYDVEWFAVRWMICTTLNHLDYDELLSIRFLMSSRCAYSRKYCNIFYTNLWVDFFLIWKYQEEIFSTLLQKLFIKRCFWSI